jgi:L-alanine-DL-glutamate epimerase-like enolase superfamily enzyme
MTGRRGAGICAIGAIDMALWDIKGKYFKQPCWKLLGGPQQPSVTPYASLQPVGSDSTTYTESLVRWLMRAKELGFSAAKLEVTPFGPYAHQSLRSDERVIIDVVAKCRKLVGRDFTLMLDVQYAWSDARQALRTLRQLEPYDLYFVETPLWIDDLDGYAYLHDHLGIRIAAGEWQTTRFEFGDLMDHGKIDVAQPDVGRCGGLSEAMRICQMARDRGRLIVPHCWKTLIGITASVHMAAATQHCPFVEYLPSHLCDSSLRRELAQNTLIFQAGKLSLPAEPGLGIHLNSDAIRHFAGAAQKVAGQG